METMELVLVLFLLPVAHSVKHSLKYFVTTSPGLQTFPEFVAVSMVDGVEVICYDSDSKTVEPRQDWVEKLIKDEPDHLEWHVNGCMRGIQLTNAVIEDLINTSTKLEVNLCFFIFMFC
uniref:MHC class I-like antigen recognition-like domain-containing protein n=1 Tax=Mastacembelus armatus TaxID=205130 RepID=A0A3Q3MMG8_9TELE